MENQSLSSKLCSALREDYGKPNKKKQKNYGYGLFSNYLTLYKLKEKDDKYLTKRGYIPGTQDFNEALGNLHNKRFKSLVKFYGESMNNKINMP